LGESQAVRILVSLNVLMELTNAVVDTVDSFSTPEHLTAARAIEEAQFDKRSGKYILTIRGNDPLWRLEVAIDNWLDISQDNPEWATMIPEMRRILKRLRDRPGRRPLW